MKMQREQLRWHQATCDAVPLDYNARFNREILWAMVKGHARNEQEQDFLRKCVDGGMVMARIFGALMKFWEGAEGGGAAPSEL